MVSAYDERLGGIYLENFCSSASLCYEFSYALTLNETKAKELTQAVYTKIAAELDHIAGLSIEKARDLILGYTWQESASFIGSDKIDGEISTFLKNCPKEDRAVYFICEVTDLTTAAGAQILEMDTDKVESIRAKLRKAITGKDYDDSDFVFLKLRDYFNGDLNDEDKQRFEKAVSDVDEMKEHYQSMVGHHQMAFYEHGLPAEVQSEIEAYVMDDEAKQRAEKKIIEDITKESQFGRMKFYIGVVAFFAVLTAGISYFFLGSGYESFNALQSLVYEASVRLEEERIDIPARSIEELNDIFNESNMLGFRPKLFKRIPAGFNLDGASIIDYDFTKILMIQFTGKAGRMFYFSYKGSVLDLPAAKPGIANETFQYQVYSSDEFNVVAWQADRNIVAMLFGPETDEALVKYAQNNLFK